jgi:hypothetical protein
MALNVSVVNVVYDLAKSSCLIYGDVAVWDFCKIGRYEEYGRIFSLKQAI